MSTKNQEIKEKTLVGMDAHTRKLALCITRWEHGSDPTKVKTMDTTLEAMEDTYKKQVPKGALTVLEASANSFSIVDRLKAIGYEAKVLPSDTLAGMARRDRINDRIDAHNLAVAHARNYKRDAVHVPDALHREYRDIFYGYINAVRDTTRCSNQIWSFCNRHGLKLPHRSSKLKVKSVRAEVEARKWSEDSCFHLNVLIENYEHALAVRDKYQHRIEEIVAGNKDMLRLTQLLGVRFIVAFALCAFIGDVHRFATAKKLVSYIGLNPTVADSGEDKSSRDVSKFGQQALKRLMVEAAQTAMRTGKSPEHKWARRISASRQCHNVGVCALARKMVCYAWHILMGHPAPNTETKTSFRRKLMMLGRRIGKKKLKELGYASNKEFADKICLEVYHNATP